MRTLRWTHLPLVLALCLAAPAIAQKGAPVTTVADDCNCSKMPWEPDACVPICGNLVIAKYDRKIVIQTSEGRVKEFAMKPGATIPVEGVPTQYDGIKAGMYIAASLVRDEKPVSVASTTLTKVTVTEVDSARIVVRKADGTTKTVFIPSGLKFLVDGKEVAVRDLKKGMKLSATLVTAKDTSAALN